jgi:O-antigen/teichoic acid export membrane protein
VSDKAPESDAKAASKEAGIYIYSRLAGTVFALLALALGARLYSVPEFAYISKLLLLYESAVALGSFGLQDVMLYYLGRWPERAAHVVRQTSFLLLCIAVPVIAIVSGIGDSMGDEGGRSISRALPWLALALVIELPTQPAVNQLLAVRRARLASILYVTFATFQPVAVLLPALTGIDLSWIPVLMAAFGASRLVAHLAIVRRIFPLAPGERTGAWLDRPTLWAILAFAVPAGLAALGGKLNPMVDKYVVEAVRGGGDLALYTNGAWEPPLVTLIPYAIGAVMQARYARLYAQGKHAEMRALWLATIRKTQVLVLPLAALLIALGEEVVTLVSGEKYTAAAPLFQIFTLAMLQRVTAYGPMLQSLGKTRSLLVTSIMLLVTNLVLSYPFTLIFGFTGAAIATVVASIPSLSFTLWQIARGLQTTIAGVMPWRHYAATLGLSAVLAFALWWWRDYLPGGPAARLGLGAVLYIATFFPLARALRLIGADDVRYLVDWLSLRMLRK